LAGETEVLGANLPQRHFVHPKIPHNQTRPRTLDRRGGKPATNRLSYSAARSNTICEVTSKTCIAHVCTHTHIVAYSLKARTMESTTASRYWAAARKQQRNGILCVVRADGCARNNGKSHAISKQQFRCNRGTVFFLRDPWPAGVYLL
jgi:hypothetical protein